MRSYRRLIEDLYPRPLDCKILKDVLLVDRLMSEVIYGHHLGRDIRRYYGF